MTDKQIIVDGVDVHWCEHYTGNIGYLTDKNWTCRAKIQGTKCEDWSNCYFKRWQRKEQECEMWKNLTIDNGAVALKYQQQLDQLKAENENLKHILQTEFITVRATGKEPVLLYKGYELDKLINYKQAIGKIKEIAQFGYRPYKVCGEHNNCCDVLNEIWNKISEVEDES